MKHPWFVAGLSLVALVPRGLPSVAWTQRMGDPVELNHVVMVVDSATYQSILKSTFLSGEFANGGVQTVMAGPEESWTGRYVMGENLYLEIFGPGGREGRDPGYVGLAFSTVGRGDIDTVYADLSRSAGPHAYKFLRTRQVQGEERAWFGAVSVDPPSMDRRLGAWIMEWDPNHLKALALEPDVEPSRAAYLRALRRARGGTMPPPDRLLGDIKRMDLALTEGERHDLEVLLLAGGWRRTATQADTIRLSGPGLDLYIVTVQAPNPRLRSIEFSLTRSPGNDEQVQFGRRSILTVHTDRTARWTFR